MRTLKWDDSSNEFQIEDNSGVDQTIWTSGNIASQGAAEAGTNNTTGMTPLRTFQAIPAYFTTNKPVQVITVFTSSGTWTKPAGADFYGVVVEVLGGGGQGGGAATTGASQGSVGGGGGSGAYSRKWIPTGSLGATETVTVGAGGTGAAAGAAGTTGGTSAFGSHITGVIGGSGGNAGSTAAATGSAGGGAGGTAGTGGDINLSGTGGGGGVILNSGATVISAVGGSSYFGGGARSKVTTGAGVAADGRGSGGGGGICTPSQSANVGGDGSAGLVIVTEYYY